MYHNVIQCTVRSFTKQRNWAIKGGVEAKQQVGFD